MANNQSGKKKFHKDFYFAVPNLEFKQRSIIFVELYIKMYKKKIFDEYHKNCNYLSSQNNFQIISLIYLIGRNW